MRDNLTALPDVVWLSLVCPRACEQEVGELVGRLKESEKGQWL
jgi:hypothetical protein